MKEPYIWIYNIKVKTKEGKFVNEKPPVKKLVKEKKKNEIGKEK